MLQLMVRGIGVETLVFSGLLGLRTPATKRSQAAWDAGHQAALPGVWAASAALTAVAVGDATLAFTRLVTALLPG